MFDASARAGHSALEAARRRVESAHLGVQTDVEALQLALVSSTREPEDLASFVFPTALVRRKPPYKQLETTVDEFRSLFGVAVSAPHSAALEDVAHTAEFCSFCKRMETALRCTLAETVPRDAWRRSRTRAAAFLGFHMADPTAALSAVLGGVVHAADFRRVEDLHAAIDDSEPQTMLLGEVIVALSASTLVAR
jgi:hypothetical protein